MGITYVILILLYMIIYVAMASSKILFDHQEVLVSEAYYCTCVLINVQVY